MWEEKGTEGKGIEENRKIGRERKGVILAAHFAPNLTACFEDTVGSRGGQVNQAS